MLEVTGAHLTFSGITALDAVDFDVDVGQLVALIGPNGAGKTSLLNCISGLYRPQRGRVVFDGRDITRLPPHHIAALGIARMFQNLALFDNMTVLDNLLLGRHHVSRQGLLSNLLWFGGTRTEEVAHRRRVEQLIEFLDLESYRVHPVSIVPYGVRKRIELGRALAMEPKLLLLDEPAAGLNQEETEDMARYLLDIKEELAIAQVLIEHDLRFVFDLADHVTVLDFGSVIARGTPERIRADPAVVSAYIGSTA